MKTTAAPSPVSRRGFLGNGAFLGGAFAALLKANEEEVFGAEAGAAPRILNNSRPDVPYDLVNPENMIYSVCMNCNTGCGIKAKIQDGVLTKIDGSPYNPWALFPHLPMTSTPDDAARVDGALCPKGQAGIQNLYDPYRLRKVLKRAGKRGEGKWETISFDQAVTEIVEGGKLFGKVPGEENRAVEGLRGLMTLRDDKLAKDMAADVKGIWDEKDAAKKKDLVAAFKTKHAAHLDKLIDPEHPDFGPKNNQFVMSWGRLKGGRSDFMKRFGSAFGTTNLHGHTTVCQGSLYFTCKAISEQYLGGSFADGKKFYWQSDLENARFVLFVGANLFEGNYGPTNRTVRLTENLATGFTKIAVVDPRFGKLASKAWKWLPIKPGEDGALAMAVIRWMLENERFDKKFLANANKAAATAAGELSYTNSTWLVKLDPKTGEPGAFARAAEHGLATAGKRTDRTEKGDVEYDEKFVVVMQNGKPVACDPKDTKAAITGDLFVDATLADGTKVKSGLQILKESAFEKTVEEWCKTADLDVKDVIAIARELTSHGKHASVDIHRGVSQHTNGFYNVLAWMTVNMLLGNYDWKGGMAAASTYDYDGAKGGPFDLTKVPGKITTFGISSIRHDVDYTKTTIFAGYPAKRNWYPIASDVYEEIIPSIGDAYPYPIKALFLYMGTPVYALPAGHTNIEVLADVNKLPLFFASDITVGTSSMYADYIFPDLTFLERWEFQGSHPNMTVKVQPVRQPVAAPIPETCKVFGQEVPISFESLLMGLGEKLGVKGFGRNALGEGLDLNRPEDFYIRAVADLAAGTKPELADAVPDADLREIELFLKSRRHLPKSVFDAEYWKSLVGEKLWPKVVYVLNRGGRFQEHAKAYKGDQLGNPYGKLLCLYQEKTARNRYAGTGKHYSGIARYLPQADYAGNSHDKLTAGHDLHLITHRVVTATKSRTIANYWLHPIMRENAILMNPRDAKHLNLANGDRVQVKSATNTAGEWDFKNGRTKAIIGALKLTETMKPGVVSFALGWGHWATGAEDIVVDGAVVKGDPRRARGVHANAAMWTDPSLRNNTCMLDPVGGSVSFYDTKVKLEKV
jgi:anaerobic selenocysteine-containing dehydrogenase